MAEVSTVQNLPAPFIEAAGKTFLEQLQTAIGGLKGADLSTVMGPQFVAPTSQISQEAQALRGGLGSFAPFLQTAAAGTGPQAYQQFMSPYQQDVIDTTLTEYDLQSQRGLQGIADRAVASGAFGGGREGVERAQYQTDSDRNRAALQAQLLGQGFGQAQAAAGQAFGQQSQLATLQPALAGQTVAGLQAAGASDLAFRQAGEDARRQGERLKAYEPYERASYLGSGLGSLSGMSTPLSPAMTGMSSPQMSPLQTALSLGSTLGGIYGAVR